MTEIELAKKFWDNVQRDIDKIKVQPANFEYIAQTGTINGTLLADLTRLLGDKQREIEILIAARTKSEERIAALRKEIEVLQEKNKELKERLREP